MEVPLLGLPMQELLQGFPIEDFIHRVYLMRFSLSKDFPRKPFGGSSIKDDLINKVYSVYVSFSQISLRKPLGGSSTRTQNGGASTRTSNGGPYWWGLFRVFLF